MTPSLEKSEVTLRVVSSDTTSKETSSDLILTDAISALTDVIEKDSLSIMLDARVLLPTAKRPCFQDA